MTTYIIDTETTDAEEGKGEIVEFAYAPFQFDKGVIGGYGGIECQRYNPTRGFPSFGALAIHHILPSDVAACPSSSSAALPIDAEYIIGHNVDFDWQMLGRPPVKRICTLAMARSVWPNLDSHKLGALVYFLNGVNEKTRQFLQDAHSAGADVIFAYYVLQAAVAAQEPGSITSVEDLYQFSEWCRIPTVMSFGKYKGSPISDVDRGWVSWYRRQADPDPYLLEAFKRAGK